MEPVSILYGGYVNIKDLFTPPYQRPLDIKKVSNMKKNWNPLAVEPIKVSKRTNGKFATMDGQHTVEGWKDKEDSELIPATIYTGLTYEQEAKLFKDFNSNKKKVNFNENLKALVEAKNSSAIEYVSSLNLAGIRFDTVESGITCHKTISEWWKRMDNELFVFAMKSYKNYVPYDLKKYNQAIIGGYLMFVTSYQDEIDRNRLTRVLYRISIQEIDSKGASKFIDRYGKSPSPNNSKAAYCCAIEFLNKYNSRLPEIEKLDIETLALRKDEGFKTDNNKRNFLK